MGGGLKFCLGAALLLLASAPAAADPAVNPYVIRYAHWSTDDERDFGAFITAIGMSDCDSVDACLHDPANPYRASDPPGTVFRSDCADLPYVLRFYFAWKRGLPFSYVGEVSPRGETDDVRYTARGNAVVARVDAPPGADGMAIIDAVRDAVSSATYRIHPDLEAPLEPDFYSPALNMKSIHPGTVIYDPNGHLAIVFRIEPDGRIRYIDAHPDNMLTRGLYDLRFVRASPGMGAGFKNWRPLKLVGAVRQSDGSLTGGQIVLASNAQIADFSDEQFFGNGVRDEDDWQTGTFTLNGQVMDYYDYVRATLAGGQLRFAPVTELGEMVQSNCADLQYRIDAVNLALDAEIQNLDQPDRLPPNIYGTEGDWETYSTPSRDARLKTAFKETRDTAQRFIALWRAHDPRIVYGGSDLAGDLLAAYDGAAKACSIAYRRSDGSHIQFGYEEARRRLFRLSFDPHQCAERRWGAADAAELSTCQDGPVKRAWYAAEQGLRNQLDRTYEVRMDFTLPELTDGTSPGHGVLVPPDIDTRAYLLSQLAPRQKKRAPEVFKPPAPVFCGAMYCPAP